MNIIQELKKYFNIKNPTFQFTVFLLLFVFASFIDLMIYETTPSLRTNYVLAFIASFAVGKGFWMWNFYAKKIPNLNFLHVLITTSIIFLLIHPTAPWWMFAVAVALAFFFKSLFRYKGQPVFNPAAFGVFMAYLVSLPLAAQGILRYPALESWWGGDLFFTFAERFPVLWIVPIFFFIAYILSAKRFNKLIHGVTFYLTYIICYLLYASLVKQIPIDAGQFLFSTFTSSYTFLAFVMVVEPKTSPVIKDQQVWLGIVGGIILFISSNVIPDTTRGLGILSITTLALLVLNTITFIVKNKQSLFGPAKAPVQPTSGTQVNPAVPQSAAAVTQANHVTDKQF